MKTKVKLTAIIAFLMCLFVQLVNAEVDVYVDKTIPSSGEQDSELTGVEIQNSDLINKVWSFDGARDRNMVMTYLYDGRELTTTIKGNGYDGNYKSDYYLSNTNDKKFDFSKIGNTKGRFLVSQAKNGSGFRVVLIVNMEHNYMKTTRTSLSPGVTVGCLYNEFVVE